MMISPELFFEKYIKDKNKVEIEKKITSLKRKITILENIINNDDDDVIFEVMSPSYELQLCFNLEYLKLAQKHLENIS